MSDDSILAWSKWSDSEIGWQGVEMKFIIAALYSNYVTHVADDTDIQQIDSYTAPPLSDKLLIKLEKHVNTG
jgi:hypothetical protein